MAASDSTAIPIKGQAYRVYFPILDADGDLVSGATGLDSEISKDGGTFTDVTAEATEIATSSGMYYLDLTAAEMNADTTILIVKTTTSGAKTTPMVLYPAEPTDIIVNVKAISDDTTAPDNLELDYDGTGYTKTNSVIGTCTTNTDMRGTDSAALATTALSDATWTNAKAAFLDHSIATIDGNVDTILLDTNELQLNQGNWLTAIGFSTHSATDIWAVGTRALTDKNNFGLSTASINLIWDDLISGITTNGSIGKLIADNLNATITSRSIPNEYDTVITALQTDLDNPNQYKADVSNLDVAISTRSSHSSSDIWSSVTRSLTDKTNFSLSTSGIKAIWDQLTSGLTTIGSLGKLLVDNINTTISSRNSTVPDIAGTAATLHGVTDGKIDVVDSIVDSIKLQTDNLPSGIAKGEALTKFDFLMVLSSDHITSAIGKTVTGTISKDGGSFVGITNTITEVSNGMYTIGSGFTSTEMNANIITLQFSNTDCDTRTITIITN